MRRRLPRIAALVVAIVLSALLLAPGAGAATAPVNDNFANAIAISGSNGFLDGTTVGATTEPGEPHTLLFPHSVWYTYTATAAGTFVVDACTESLNTVIATFTGNTVSSIAPVGTTDDQCGDNGHARVPVTPGAVVRVAVTAVSGAGEPFTLHWQLATATAPLIEYASDRTLNCTTSSVTSDWLQFFTTGARNPRPQSCATLVAVPGVGLFGPGAFADDKGQVAGEPLRSFAPFAQSRSGQQVVTAVALPGTGLALVQTETYTGGTTVRVDVELRNSGPRRVRAVVYRTGDCFPGADLAFAIVGNGAAGCEAAQEYQLLARPAPAGEFIRFEPIGGGSHFAASNIVAIRNAIGSRRSLTNKCECATPIDPAAALSWSVHVPAHGRVSVGHRLTMSDGPGRDAIGITTTLTGTTHRQTLSAHLTDGPLPLAGARVHFTRGAVKACSAVTDRTGTARCHTSGPPDIFTATYFGDASHSPVIRSFGKVDPNPPVLGPRFPDCARFDPNDTAGAFLGDGHFYEVVIPTLAPACTNVIYRAYADGVEIGELRGDRTAVRVKGQPSRGVTVLYIGTGLDAGIAGCITVESINPQTGGVIDHAPGATAEGPCLPEVGGQKFR